MLAAIGQVKSGGRGSMAGTDQGWPWTVDSLGQGRRFPTKAEAVAHVQGPLLSGIRSIDVGCFQVNLQWHPTAFASLEDAFDPGVNACYAASFLVSLRGDQPGWSGALAHYHSRTEALGTPYSAAVAAAWRGGAVGLGYPAGLSPRRCCRSTMSGTAPSRCRRPIAPGNAADTAGLRIM